MKPDFKNDAADEAALLKELVLQVRKTIGPFAAPKRVILVGDLPKTRSGKVSPFLRLDIVQVSTDLLLSDHAPHPPQDLCGRGRLVGRPFDARRPEHRGVDREPSGSDCIVLRSLTQLALSQTAKFMSK
jgi:hypothetical protein